VFGLLAVLLIFGGFVDLVVVNVVSVLFRLSYLAFLCLLGVCCGALALMFLGVGVVAVGLGVVAASVCLGWAYGVSGD
ncbi:hypothetical protein RA272_30880, partial [Pseudomonas syringae pv. tagetis]